MAQTLKIQSLFHKDENEFDLKIYIYICCKASIKSDHDQWFFSEREIGEKDDRFDSKIKKW